MKNKWILGFLVLALASFACVNNINGLPGGSIPVVLPTNTPATTTFSGPNNGGSVPSDWPVNLFLSPVRATEVFNAESAWLVAEPGVVCDPSCPWDNLAINTVYNGNAPEGGFLYVSTGQLTLNVDGMTFNLPHIDGNNYLVLVRGRIDDGRIDTNRNLTVKMSGFVAGHGRYSTLPNGAYVSQNWLRDQLAVSMNVQNASTSGTNCGALGCTETRILMVDVDTHFYQMWLVGANDLNAWTLIKSGIK